MTTASVSVLPGQLAMFVAVSGALVPAPAPLSPLAAWRVAREALKLARAHVKAAERVGDVARIVVATATLQAARDAEEDAAYDFAEACIDDLRRVQHLN